MKDQVSNIVFAGLGGQGVIKASDIFAAVVFNAGFDVKKAEIHGMSQRGGSVTSDVRFGEKVASPMVPSGAADFLVVLSPDQVENNRSILRTDGVLIMVDQIDLEKLPHKRSINVALLGILSRYLDFDTDLWIQAIHANFPEKLHEINRQAFTLGREIKLAEKQTSP
ncbi:MAG: indolepyruvate oxidoreductase subunit beta [Planctomycetes bacterium]|nr:indolepyruvate oxidoreductase subunit beta [Planctomycetota bacterium]